MARTDTLRHFLTDVANSIRNKKGTTDTIIASNFDTEIDSIETSVGKYAPRFISFRDYNKMDLDYEISNIDTSNVTDMKYMFLNCKKLTSLDLSNFNTSNVIDMSSMFSNCSNLTSLGLSNFNISKVRNMSNMFSNCSNLTSLDLSNFNISDVTNISSMFYNCSNLTSLDLSNFNTSDVTDMHSMFQSCSNLTYLDIRNFDFTKVISDSNMFNKVPSNCEIIVKDDTAKKWIFARRRDFTNVKTVVEKEAEIVV